MKWLALAVFFGVVVSCGQVVAGENQSRPDRNLQPPSLINADLDPCRYFTPNESMVGFSIEKRLEGGLVPLRVPKRYVERAPVAEGGVKYSQLFSSIEIPTFRPLPQGELTRRNQQGLPWNWMSFSVNDFRELSATAGLRLRRNDLPFGDPRRREERDNPPRPRDLPSEPAAHSLTKVIPGPNRGSGEDMFVHYGPDGALDAWLLCASRDANGVLNERCEHHFRATELDVWVSYKRTELPNWRDIQDNITRFLVCATSDIL